MRNLTENHCYLAAPFFNPVQLVYVEKLEHAISKTIPVFSPRKGANALEMNMLLKNKEKPSEDLRNAVFRDNVENIDNAALVVAVVDGFDVGVMFEVGYAYAMGVPIVTITDHDYGCNLMLAQSTVGHLKSVDQLQDVLFLMKEYSSWMDMVIAKYRTSLALTEGPTERDQFKKGK